MTGFAFRKNATFEWNGALFRVREITPNDELLLEALNSGELSVVQRQVLLAEYAAGTLRARSARPRDPSEPLVYSRPLSELEPHVRAQVERRHHYLRAVCSEGEPVWVDRYLRPLVSMAALEIGDARPPTATTLYRWFKKYERCQGDNRSLVPRFDRRGRTSPQPQRLLDLLAACAQDAFKQSPRASVRMIHDRLRKEVEAWNRAAAPSERLTVPHIRTTYRLFQSGDVYELMCLREGKSAADKRLRVVKQGPKSERVLERVEIDHTPLDLFLVDDETGLPMGRPTLTVGIDHYSRMPCGYFLSFGDPSAAAVVGLLRHMILPKTLDASTLLNEPPRFSWRPVGLSQATTSAA